MNTKHLNRFLMRICVPVFITLGALSCRSAEASNTVVFETNQGNFTVELFQKKAPISVKNFLAYVDSGFYEGTIFHRVIDGFMVQVGGFDADMKRKTPNAPIKNESNNGLLNKTGTLSMARTSDPDSATSQFFISLVDNQSLDPRPGSPGYAVFGKISVGMDVIAKIGKVETDCPSNSRQPCSGSLPPGMRDVPKKPVIINKVYRQ